MQDNNFRVLLIEDDTAVASLIQSMLAKAKEGSFSLERVDNLATGLDCLAKANIDIVLLDWGYL